MLGFLKKHGASSSALLKNMERKLSAVISPRARSVSTPVVGVEGYREVQKDNNMTDEDTV